MNNTSSNNLHGWWQWAIPPLFGAFLIWMFLHTFFQGDDFAILCWLRYDHPSPANWFVIWHTGLWRPFQLASLWVEVRLFDGIPEYYRITQGIVFIISIVLYQSLIAKTTNRLTAFISAVFFAATLSHWEALQWICASGEIWMGFFFLLCLHSLLRYRDTGKTSYRWLSIICHIMALLCKGSSVALLPIIIVWFWVQKSLKAFRCPIIVLGMSLPWLTVLIFRSVIAAQGEAVEQGIFSLFGMHIIHNFGAFYLRMFTHWYSQPPFWLSVLSTLAIVITAGYLLRHRHWFTLSILAWSVIGISSYIGVNTPGVYPSRYTYLSGMGFYWLLGIGFNHLIQYTDFPRRAALLTICIAMLLQSFGAAFLPEIRYWLRHDQIFQQRLNELRALNLPEAESIWVSDFETPPGHDKAEFFRTFYALINKPPQNIYIDHHPEQTSSDIRLLIQGNQLIRED